MTTPARHSLPDMSNVDWKALTLQNALPSPAIVDAVDDTLAEARESVVTGVEHIITLEKTAGRSLDDNKSEIQILSIVDAVQTPEKIKRGWKVAPAEQNANRRFRRTGDKTNGYTYRYDLLVTCQPTKIRSTIGMEFDNIVAAIDSKAQLPANRWRVSAVDDSPYVPKEATALVIDPNESIGYAPIELPTFEAWQAEFGELYGLDDYIEIVYRSIQAAIDSNWTQRVNLLFVGPPACGKTNLCKIIKRLLGSEAVLEFDATSTTMAGAQQMLSEREEMPRVLIVEEIEKAPEASLQWLLSVLDLRGEIRKTTARGSILKDVHMVGIATVNNAELFEKLASGALSSRFAMPLQFMRPTREILWKILKREIDKIGGNIDWIEPALDFAEEIDLSDPRKLIAITVTGREKLLDGTYQAMMKRTMPGLVKRALAGHFNEKGE